MLPKCVGGNKKFISDRSFWNVTFNVLYKYSNKFVRVLLHFFFLLRGFKTFKLSQNSITKEKWVLRSSYFWIFKNKHKNTSYIYSRDIFKTRIQILFSENMYFALCASQLRTFQSFFIKISSNTKYSSPYKINLFFFFIGN